MVFMIDNIGGLEGKVDYNIAKPTDDNGIMRHIGNYARKSIGTYLLAATALVSSAPVFALPGLASSPPRRGGVWGNLFPQILIREDSGRRGSNARLAAMQIPQIDV